MSDLIERLRKRKVFNGNTTVRRDGPGGPWIEERQTETDPLCDEAATALAEAQAEVARLRTLLREAWDTLDDGWGTEQVTREAAAEYFDLMPRIETALLPVARDGMEG